MAITPLNSSKMNVLFDINHPAHVHLFKHAIRTLKQHGHNVIVTVKDIPAAKQLLKSENIEYISLSGKKRDSLLGKAVMQLHYNFLLWQLAVRKNIHLGVGSSVTIAQVSRFCKMKSIFLDDDDDNVEPLIVKHVHPYCNTILSPVALTGKRKAKNVIFYKGTHELAYLHPARFTPNAKTLESLGVNASDSYFILRFNAFKAHHDGNVYGLTLEQKLQLVQLLTSYGKVFITAERETDPELEPYRLSVSPEKIHDLLAFATLFVGDSQTMTSEAAILGTPAFRCNSLVGELSCIEDIEHNFGLAFGYKPEEFENMLDDIQKILNNPNSKKEWQIKRAKFLEERIDTTSFLVDFIENYPYKKHPIK
jgi:predicted glycosyltransferase